MCLCGGADQAKTFEPQQTEASHLPTESEELQSSAPPTQVKPSSPQPEDGSPASSAPDNGDAAEVPDGAHQESQEQQEKSPPAGKDAQQMVCL